MSDPVTNAEIEDVLSSIRRLVSEDSRNVSRARTVDPSPDMERLVLTPSLRVAEDSDPVAPPEDAEPGQPEVDVQDAWKDEADPPWNDPKATLYEAVDGRAEREFPDDDDAWSGDAADFAQHAEPEESTASDPEEWQDGEPVGETGGEPVDDGAPPDEDASLEATVEALETAIGETPDQWEPDGEGGDDYAGTPVRTLEWEDHEAAAPTGDLPDDFEEVSAGDEPEDAMDAMDGVGLDPLESEDTILDEESLRELVTEIVREELQGALGERITRNVRKLVRREIHRALTAQELD